MKAALVLGAGGFIGGHQSSKGMKAIGYVVLISKLMNMLSQNPINFQMADLNKYDVVILAVNHSEYEELYSGEWISPDQIIYDVKSVIQHEAVLSL